MEIPKFLIERYQFWKKNTFEDYKGIYQQASKSPQKPIAMIITCCDSRILENTIFGGNVGDYFIHRNIANIVPSKKDKEQNIQTLSAIEYGLKVLNIPNLIILGHSNRSVELSSFSLAEAISISASFSSYLNCFIINLFMAFISCSSFSVSYTHLTLPTIHLV